MAYQFKLEALRRFREHQEETKQKKLAEAQMDLEADLNRLGEYLAQRERTGEDLQQCQQQSATGRQIAVYLNYLQKLNRDIEQQQDIVARKRQVCEAARQEVLEAMKKRKALEKLKEKSLQRYLENLDHEEEKFIGEMAINRFTHKGR